MATIYDGVFRTILNDCRKLIIPVINEIFGETYTGKEEIRFYPNEHFLDQQDEADKERITDTNFTIFGKIPTCAVAIWLGAAIKQQKYNSHILPSAL